MRMRSRSVTYWMHRFGISAPSLLCQPPALLSGRHNRAHLDSLFGLQIGSVY